MAARSTALCRPPEGVAHARSNIHHPAIGKFPGFRAKLSWRAIADILPMSYAVTAKLSSPALRRCLADV
jgi:hypothetical protein